ncbi:hypothetical protein PR202_gb21958 [Eleusine coracana subsp. coracana]|uniref:Uncharacterized protein n=1 Tax=Eleusine coracana subsp. coracana TaxID=191504 RepID=A0AAV5FF10_ELECO|nr:hypothetical protein PR202_gb21958 [Eleusine coracana subsp. coracana]
MFRAGQAAAGEVAPPPPAAESATNRHSALASLQRRLLLAADWEILLIGVGIAAMLCFMIRNKLQCPPWPPSRLSRRTCAWSLADLNDGMRLAMWRRQLDAVSTERVPRGSRQSTIPQLEEASLATNRQWRHRDGSSSSDVRRADDGNSFILRILK